MFIIMSWYRMLLLKQKQPPYIGNRRIFFLESAFCLLPLQYPLSKNQKVQVCITHLWAAAAATPALPNGGCWRWCSDLWLLISLRRTHRVLLLMLQLLLSSPSKGPLNQFPSSTTLYGKALKCLYVYMWCFQ